MGSNPVSKGTSLRAHWLDPLSIQDEYILKEDSLHHLVNVVRIEVNEKLLLLNGKGLFVETHVVSISKKELRLKLQTHYEINRSYEMDLILAMPKRDALELSLKEATELGFTRIFLVKSEYSQMRFPEEERIHKLLISSLEQSNAAYLPEIISVGWDMVPWENYTEIILLDSQTKGPNSSSSSLDGIRQLLIVGPEGGFSPVELDMLHGLKNIRVVNLPTPILRTPTAVATGAGILLQRLLK